MYSALEAGENIKIPFMMSLSLALSLLTLALGDSEDLTISYSHSLSSWNFDKENLEKET